MTRPGSVGADGRLRLFCALTLPDPVLDALERWQRDSLRCDARTMSRDHLHVTLAFLGWTPADRLEAIEEAVVAAAAGAVEPLLLAPSGYRETRSVGMLVLDDEQDRAAGLAADLHARLEELGVYRRESRPWLAHVTVLRFQQPPRLQPDLPELGAFSPSGAAVYHSVLRLAGAQYQVLHHVALGG
jgi:2'-5' RNA ligase